MSLGVALKGPEGIVLAADSRLTLFHPLPAQIPAQNILITPTYDNATKLLHAERQKYIGVVTYGLGILGQTSKDFRSPKGILPEFNEKLSKEPMTVKDFAEALSKFLLEEHWNKTMPPLSTYKGADMCFFVAGYDVGKPYGTIFWFSIPRSPQPVEYFVDNFGVVWDGQKEFADRLIRGYEQRLIGLTKDFLKLSEDDAKKLNEHLSGSLNIQMPIQFLPLQDCVDLSIFLIKTTMMMQAWVPMIRGVGGAIDVATITSEYGFKPVQLKQITGEQKRTTCDRLTAELENVGGGGNK